MGNQLTTYKLKQVSLLESLYYEKPIEEIEVEEISVDSEGNDIQDFNIQLDDDGKLR